MLAHDLGIARRGLDHHGRGRDAQWRAERRRSPGKQRQPGMERQERNSTREDEFVNDARGLEIAQQRICGAKVEVQLGGQSERSELLADQHRNERSAHRATRMNQAQRDQRRQRNQSQDAFRIQRIEKNIVRRLVIKIRVRARQRDRFVFREFEREGLRPVAHKQAIYIAFARIEGHPQRIAPQQQTSAAQADLRSPRTRERAAVSPTGET